jgi:ERCC4-related helicase
MIGKGKAAKNPMAGFPDIAGLLSGGRLFAIEVKAKDGITSEAQDKWIAKLKAGGALVLVAKSVSEVIDAFKGVMPCSKQFPTTHLPKPVSA